MTAASLLNYFRLPEKLFEFSIHGDLSTDPSFFDLGAGAMCYGRSTAAQHGLGLTVDGYGGRGFRIEQGRIGVPFDPDEVVENLRHERYVRGLHGLEGRRIDNQLLRSLYYRWLRPLLPALVRRHLQRTVLGDWRTIRFPRWPVDGTVEHILERVLSLAMAAQGIDRLPFVWFWPNGTSACAIVTHDVDNISGRNFCSGIMDLDDDAGVKASFQIIPEGRYSVPSELLDEIRQRGFEVNVHDLNHDGRLFSDEAEFARRVERINEYGRRFKALGFRSGQLYRNQTWYSRLTFSYDMSIPSVAHLEPQRGGCCSITPFFIGRILELPVTTIQDYSLFHVLRSYSTDLWIRQTEAIIARHGLASFLIHPEQVTVARARRTYAALLAYLARLRDTRNVWMALPREVDRWWRDRHATTVVRDADGWHLDGPAKDRACLAFATLTPTGLTFAVEGLQ
jgi:hypothetical protein